MPLALLCTSLTGSVTAQDTVSLKHVEIVAVKTGLSELGKKTQHIDSSLKAQFKFNSVAEVLAYNTPVFIKSYGPGGIATTSFRGGNASQTAVLWNGFNLQNAMLGQSDLSLMPAVLFDNISLEYGGSSSLWGSGAVGGSILLDNKLQFNRGLRTVVNAGGGSFGLLNGSAQLLFSEKRFISSTRLYASHSQNNFLYRDSLDHQNPLKSRQHAAYDFKGLMQEFKFILNSKQVLSLSAWLNNNQRMVPAPIPGGESRSYQLDQAQRLSASWNYTAARFRSTLRAAGFVDQLNFDDSLQRVFFKKQGADFDGGK